MYSVTKRISMIKQPRGGYINKKELVVTQLDDGITLNENENIHASLVGLAVDYMTRFLMGAQKEEAFSISLKGALALDLFTGNKKQSSMKNATSLLADIKGLDKKSITNACKLVGYDVCFRAGIIGYKPVEEINPDKDTIENIVTMINRSLSFWKEYGPITKDTLWDFKVSKDEPKPKYTLQLLVYYIMGMHSIHKEFKSIKNLGIYNPRMNKVYTVSIDTIPQSVINEVSKDVIGY